MGCCVTKSTYLSYINELKNTTKQADDLEDKVMSRRSLNNLDSIDLEDDNLDFLQYQEQLRSQKFIQITRKLAKIHLNPTNTLLTPSDYFQARMEQTEFNELITKKFVEIAEKLEEIHKSKIQEFNERLQTLNEFIKTKIRTEEPKIQDLLKALEELKNYDSINALTQSLLKLSELQKDLEILQRKYDFKHFLAMQHEKNKEKDNMRAKIEEIKAHIEKLNSNWAEMKDEQRKKAEELQNLQDSLALNKEKISTLTAEKQEIQEDLSKYGSSSQSFAEIEEEILEKEKQIESLKTELEVLQKSISDNSVDLDEMAVLKKRKSCLNSEVGEISKQVDFLAELQKKTEEEANKKNEEERELRDAMIKELQEEIAAKSAQMQKINEMYVNDLKNQILLNIFHQSMDKIKSSMRVWRINASKKTEILQNEANENRNSLNRLISRVKTETLWDWNKFLNFFSKFLAEKLKSDEAALGKNKLPIPLYEFTESYFKSLYNDEWELQCCQMMNTLLSETSDPISSIAKSMLGLSKEPFSYCFTLFLTEASYNFDMAKNPLTETVLFDKVIQIVEVFAENQRDVVVPTLFRMRPEGMNSEDFVLVMLKLKLMSIGKNFTDYCDSPESFMDVAKKDLELLVDDEVLEGFKSKCEQEFDFNFDMKIEMSINTLQIDKFGVDKGKFLEAFVEGYRDSMSKDEMFLDSIIARFETIDQETFNKLLIRISPDTSQEILSNLFDEAVIETPDGSTIKPQIFKKIVLKYGIGGLGVGQFNITKLKSASNAVLKALNRIKKLESLKKGTNPLGIKIVPPSTAAKYPSQISPKNKLLKAGTNVKKLSETRKSPSPISMSEKNLRREAPFHKKSPSIGK